MREIKFREWDQEREDMMPGHGMSYSEREEFDDSVSFRFEHEEDLDYTGRQSETDCHGTPYRVLEQYTGLDDINGKPIYEGDIVRISPIRQREKSFVGAVHYGRVDPSFTIHDNDGHDFRLYSSGEYRTYEVIGNIFEDKQLLEAEK